MKILVLDLDGVGLNLAMRLQDAGHRVRTFMAPGPKPDETGEGLIDRVHDWKASMGWADLIVSTSNVKYGAELESYFKRGFPILGTNQASAEWEHDRAKGQEAFKRVGIDILPYHEFQDYDKAIAFVKKEKKAFVSKPWGSVADKNLSYVPSRPDDLVCRLERWKAEGLKGQFILQEKIDGVEMAAGAWFGPGGFSRWINETWEEKRLMAGGYGPNCYSEDTEVLTARGWLRFGEVTMEDDIASYQPKNNSLFFEKPQRIHWTDYQGEMIAFSNRYVDLLVTPTHNMWVARRKTDALQSAWKFYPAKACPSEFVIQQAAQTTNPDISLIDLGEITLPADDWFRFLGIYLSEGYTDSHQRTHICQCDGPKKDMMRSILRRAGMEFYEYEKKFTLNDPIIAQSVRIFGLSHDKFIPRYVKMASARQIRLFLEAFCLGDGDNHAGHNRYHSGSYRLISDIQELLLRIGVVGVITTDDRPTMVSPISGVQYPAQPVYSLEETTRAQTSVRGKKVVAYKGKIGCVTLATTHLLFVRRNGRVAISGNTGEMGTVLRYTRTSPLFDKVVKPLEEELHKIGFVGDVDVNCIITPDGTPYPLEFTMRMGWPAFNLQMALHQGDPAEWMLDLVQGRDTLKCSTDICCGVVMTLGDYPWEKWKPLQTNDWPLRGVRKVMDKVALVSVKMGKAPTQLGGTIEDRACLVTTGEYVLVALGTGRDVEAARKDAYAVVDQIGWPPHKNVRVDIGERLEGELAKLHKMGYAEGMEYGRRE